jgi:hypothetical protein
MSFFLPWVRRKKKKILLLLAHFLPLWSNLALRHNEEKKLILYHLEYNKNLFPLLFNGFVLTELQKIANL